MQVGGGGGDNDLYVSVAVRNNTEIKYCRACLLTMITLSPRPRLVSRQTGRQTDRQTWTEK